jgi:hypothetical protein
MGPLGAAGRVGMVGMGVGAGAGEARIRAEQEGATPEQRSTATALGTIPGAFEVFAPMQMLGRLSTPIQQGIVASIKRALVAGGEEAAQEAASQIAQNLIAKGIYKPDQAIIEQVGESAAYGGATGALVQGIMDMALGRRAKAATQPQAQPQQPGAQPQAQQPVPAPEAAPVAEPTLRGEEPPLETPEEIAAGPTKAAQRKLLAEQKAFLKQYEEQAAQREAQAAEYERVKALTPEEYAAEQMQGRGKTTKNTYSPDAQEALDAELAGLGYQTEPTRPGQGYAAKQIALAKEREPIVNVPVIASYLMQDPEQARVLVKSFTPIPGLTQKQSNAVLGGLKLQLAALDEKAAKEIAAVKASATGAAKQRLSIVEEEERQALQAQRDEELRLTKEAETERRVAPEILAVRDLGRPEKPPAYRGEPKKVSERLGTAQGQLSEEEAPLGEDPLVDKLVQTLPLADGKITPGDVYLGLGTKKQDVRDLQAQLAVSRLTGNKSLQEDIKRQLNEKRAIPTEGGLGTEGGKYAAEFISRSKVPALREGEAEGDKFAAEQRSTLLGMARLLNSSKIMLPGKREAMLSEAKEKYVAQHAAEIEARRKAFELSPMEDWERAEARARALEGLNTLTNNWGRFEDPVISVKALQNITRESVYQNLYKATQRRTDTTQTNFEEKIKRPTMGPRIAAPDELTLKNRPNIAATDADTAQQFIEQVLSQIETKGRTRVEPTTEKTASKKISDMASLAQLFKNAEVGGRTAEIDAATVALLENLRTQLRTNNDENFVSLARETAQKVAEGNLPNAFDVRDLGEMMKAFEVAGRSETRPGATPEELQRTSAQPQKELFPEAAVQTQRANPANFQKMLDSKNIQGMRDALAKQRADNIAALQAAGKALPTLKNRLAKAENNYKRTQKRAEAAGTEAFNYVSEYKTALKDAQDLVVVLRDELLLLENQLKDVELTKEILATEPTDMRFLISAPKMLATEKPLRNSIKLMETEITNAQNLIASIQASYQAQQTLVVPAQKRAEKTGKQLEQAQAELSKAKNEANAATKRAERLEQADKEAKAKAEAEIGTPKEVFEAAAQAGREGLNLPGIRLEKDTTRMRQTIANMRRAMGSLDEQIVNEKDETKLAELRASRAEYERKLETVYADAPSVKTVLQSKAAEKAEKEYEDAQIAGFDQRMAKRRKRAGEKAPKLQKVEQIPLYRPAGTARVVQPFRTANIAETAAAITDKLVKARSDLAEVHRRVDFLRANGKDKVKNRLTDTFKKLQEEQTKLKERIESLDKRQKRIIDVESKAEYETPRAKEIREAKEVKAESNRFARGVETTSPDLTASQVQALENNDIRQAMNDIAADGNTSKLNQVVAQRLAAMLDTTDVKIERSLTDEDGKSVLGMATSKLVQLNRNGGLSQEILLHEGTHAATERVIVQYEKDPTKLTEIQRVAVRELMALHAAIKNDPRITSVSAKGSLSEFVAEVFSNKNLQNQLSQKKWRLSDAWKGFKSIIMRMLGVKDPETMLGAALQSIDALMVPSSDRTVGGKETAVSRRLSAKDIAALHDGSNSMRQFADQFGTTAIKQKDRTAEDANRIGQEYLETMSSYPTDYVAEALADKLPFDTLMSDGSNYNPKSMVHYFEATPQTIANYMALNNPELRESEASDINTKRIDDLRALIDNMQQNPEYTYVEQALVARAASKYAVLSGKDGRLKLADISSDNRHVIAVVGSQEAGHVIQELRAGKGLKAAFLDGLQKAADKNALNNKRKDGWEKFNQSDEYQAAVDLNAGAANTSWCTGQSVNTAASHISSGDFYIHYKDGNPEVAVRMQGQDTVDEVRGNTANQSLTPEQQAIAKEFLNANSFSNSITYFDQMERKAALIKAFKDDVPLPTKVLYGGDWAKTTYVGEGLHRVSVPTTSAYAFTNFEDIDGEIEEYRPKKPKGFEKQVVAKLKEGLKTAIQNNEFPGVDIFFFDAANVSVVFDGNVHEVSAQDIRGASKITLEAGAPSFLNLEKVNHVHMLKDVTATLPKITKLHRVSAESATPTSIVTLGKNATVKYVDIPITTNNPRNFLTINNATVVNQIVTREDSTIDLTLPDAKYAELPEFRFGRHMAKARIAASRVFDDWVDSNGYEEAFKRYRRNMRPRVGDDAKMSKVGVKAYSMAVKLTDENTAEGLMAENTDTYTIGEPEPIRFSVVARPAMRITADDARATLGARLRTEALLARELGRPPTEAELADRLAEIRATERAAQERPAPTARTLRLSSTQQELIDGENEARDNRGEKILETAVEKATFLEKYYENNPGKEVSKTDFSSVVIGAAHQFFDGATTPEAFVKRAKKFNELLNVPADVRVQTQLDKVDAPKRIGDKPPAVEFTEEAETPRYARAQATGFEDELATASELIAKPKTVRDRVEANLGLAFRTQVLDRLAPLEKVAAEQMDSFKGMQMMYYLRMADQKMSFVQQSVGRGVPQLVEKTRADGQVERLIESQKGPNLVNVVNTLKDAPGMNAQAANQLFTLYLAAKRADRVGYDVLNFGASEAKIKSAVAKIEANEELRGVFEKARTQYNEYNRELVKFLEATGAITPEEAARLAKTNDYIPYYREQNGNAVLVIGGEGTFKVGNLTDQPQLRQLIGGEEKILDFLTSSVQNTSMIMDMGLRNQAAKNAMFELANLNMAQFLGGNPSGPDIVRFKDKGVEKYVRIDTAAAGIPADLLVKGMEGIPVNNSAIVKAMGGFSTLLRRSITISPLYSARQIFRDSVAAPLLSGADFVPVFGALKQIGNSATREKLEARGIVGGQILTGTNEDLTRILGELQSGKMGIGQFIAKAEAFAMEADALTRRAQYDSYIEQGLSEMEATMMSLESMNFNRKGLSPSARFLSTVIPFFNAQLQSLDVLYRSVTGKMPMSERLDIQGKLLRRGALLASLSVAYALMMQDDETYKNANPDEKYNNFFVHVPGIKEAIRVPIPFEIGYIFKSLPEAIVNIMASEKGGEEAYKAFKNIAIQTVPGGTSLFLPAALKPIVENVSGYSFFTGRQIETKREQMQQAEYRYRDNTSELAKQVGAMTGTSPIKIENLIRGYTGSMGVALAQSFNFAMPTSGSPEQAAKRLSDTAVIGPLFQPEDAGGIVSAVYDRLQTITEIKRTYESLLKSGQRAEAMEFLQRNMDDYAKSAIAGNVQQQLTKITQAVNAVKASNMSPEEKRESLDRLQQLRINIAANVRGAL